MTLLSLASVAQTAFELWLAALALVVGWSFLTHPERLNGLLSTAGDGGIEPERLQGLLVFASAAAAYVFEACKALGSAPVCHHLQELACHPLPDISQTWLTVLTGSQALYLGGKVSRILS
jgi:hypothetical protein